MDCKQCGKKMDVSPAKGMCYSCYAKDIASRSEGVCSGCGETKPIKAKGLCGACYIRLQRHGTTEYIPRPEKGDDACSKCKIEPVHAKGLCKTCYSKRYLEKLKHGDCFRCGEEKKLIAKGLCQKCYGLYIEKKKSAECIGCGEVKPIRAMGMCRKCHVRYQRHDDPTQGRVKKGDEPCSYCGARPVHAKHLCGNCYTRFLANGDPQRVKKSAIKECKLCGKIKLIKAKGLCVSCYSLCNSHNLTPDQYIEMYERQGGVCAICGKAETYKHQYQPNKVRRLAVDHDHETGVVRALLCCACNTGLGSFKDSPRRIKNAMSYLDQHAPSG